MIDIVTPSLLRDGTNISTSTSEATGGIYEQKFISLPESQTGSGDAHRERLFHCRVVGQG